MRLEKSVLTVVADFIFYHVVTEVHVVVSL